MKSIKTLALTFLLGVAGFVYATGQAQERTAQTDASQKTAAASCCMAGASCCANGGGACCQAHHAKREGHAAQSAAASDHKTMSDADSAACCSAGAACCANGGGACCSMHDKRNAAASHAHGQNTAHGEAKGSCCKAHKSDQQQWQDAAHASMQYETKGESCCGGGASCCTSGGSCCAAKAGAAKANK